MRHSLLLAACAACVGGFAATLTDISLRVVSPWTNLVEIAYSLDEDLVPANKNGRLIQTVTVRDEGTDASLVLTNSPSEEALFPRQPSFSAGTHRLVWNSAKHGFHPARAKVEIAVHETTAPRTYCVVDLSGGSSAASHPVFYMDDVPAGGWSDAYKTDRLVLRLIEPGTFTMGDQVHGGPAYPDITLTEPYYIGVFEMTQRQWELMTGKKPSAYSNETDRATHPVENVRWGTDIRGTSKGRNWPKDTTVDPWPTVMLAGLRNRSGILFDLPTEAQWEYAARAGTTTDYGNGTDWSNAREDAGMDALGRYQYNGSGTAPVGSYAPNAWGLYDMHGNVAELCLDRWTDALPYGAGAVDPKGSDTASVSDRVVRGGNWESVAKDCTSASRSKQMGLDSQNKWTGLRLVCPAEVASESERVRGESPETSLALDVRNPLPVGGDPLPIDFDPLYSGVDPAAGAYTVRVVLDGAETLVETNAPGRLEGWTAHWHTNTLRHVVLRDGVEVGTPLERVLVSTLGPESLTLGECLNAPALEFSVGGTGGWSRDTVTNLDGVVSLRTRDTGDDGCTWLETTVVGEGTLTFWWKVSSEGSKKTLYDYMTFSVDGRELHQFGWEVDWTEVSVEIKGEGEHVLRWAYLKDDQDAEGDDCGWLDRVSWSGAVPGPSRDETETTPVPVPYAWLDRFPSLLSAADGDYETAANAPTGKRDAAGNPMHVWQDFVAGTDPTDPDDVLRVFIEMKDGQPSVTWSPDLGEARRYRLRGAAAPAGPWSERTAPAPADRFFKVSVSLPE